MAEAFTYCWTDHTKNSLYIGIHKGPVDDGYIASSQVFLEAYLKQPENFSRQIIAKGTYADMIALETALLKSVDAKANPHFYNSHNGDGKFFNKGHSDKTKESLKRAWVARREKYPRGTFTGRSHSVETKVKMADAKSGCRLTPAHKQKISDSIQTIMQTPEYKKRHSDGVKANWIKRRGTQNRG